MLVVLYHGQFLVFDLHQGQIHSSYKEAVLAAAQEGPEVSVLCILNEALIEDVASLLTEQDDEG
jgi:methylmalonyl-CoA mutase cobalamin-binding subunit